MIKLSVCKDFNGKPIHDGDAVELSHGRRGTVQHNITVEDPDLRWTIKLGSVFQIPLNRGSVASEVVIVVPSDMNTQTNKFRLVCSALTHAEVLIVAGTIAECYWSSNAEAPLSARIVQERQDHEPDVIFENRINGNAIKLTQENNKTWSLFLKGETVLNAYDTLFNEVDSFSVSIRHRRN